MCILRYISLIFFALIIVFHLRSWTGVWRHWWWCCWPRPWPWPYPLQPRCHWPARRARNLCLFLISLSTTLTPKMEQSVCFSSLVLSLILNNHSAHILIPRILGLSIFPIVHGPLIKEQDITRSVDCIRIQATVLIGVYKMWASPEKSIAAGNSHCTAWLPNSIHLRTIMLILLANWLSIVIITLVTLITEIDIWQSLCT